MYARKEGEVAASPPHKEDARLFDHARSVGLERDGAIKVNHKHVIKAAERSLLVVVGGGLNVRSDG